MTGLGSGVNEEDDEEEEEEEAAEPAAGASAAGGREFVRQLYPGLIVKVTGVGASATHDSLSGYVSSLGQTVKFVELSSVATDGVAFLRLPTAEAAIVVAADLANEGNANAQKAAGSDKCGGVVLT